jgi:hypothetical protein
LKTETLWLDGIEGVISENGKFYPVIKGGSDVATYLENAQGPEPESDEDEDLDTDIVDDDDDELDEIDDEEIDDDEDDDSFSIADDFLKTVDEDHRELLEPYVKRWDAAVTRRFQNYSQTLAPYQQLGEVDEIQQAMEFVNYARENPEELYRLLKEEFEDDDQGSGPGTSSSDSPLQGLPPEIAEQFGELRSVVELMAQDYIDRQNQTKEQQEDEAVETLLGQLHTEFGDFDEEYVLTKIANGTDPAKAVKQFNRLQEKAIEKALADSGIENLPSVLNSRRGGSGPPVQEQSQRLGDIPSKDLKNVVADIVAQAAAQNQ